ncbi:hypothetical protein [Methylorubrum salsuginis]|uniref:hypothetical protein n=1 Tax=Methylorubrum salsuginis TaxID=414703 RepID=UPI000B861C4F|nr:hypothetical protein [Methylorubrum salsuginis]
MVERLRQRLTGLHDQIDRLIPSLQNARRAIEESVGRVPPILPAMSAELEEVRAAANGSVIDSQRADGGSSLAALTQVDVVTATSTWTKPPWAREVTFDVGGGCGRRWAAGSVRTGGGWAGPMAVVS